MTDVTLAEELIRKYKWAGKIRFLSFLLLFLFILLMKVSGGYPYLNVAFSSLIFVEAILNQPYNFFLKRVNIYRFQFYQMITDIISISWVLYYMGGIKAPVVSMGYYAVILWAGVSGYQAVFFAVITSCLFFSLVVLIEHFGIFASLNYLNYRIQTTQMFSLLLGNVAFLFAFGYFSAHSSRVIKFLERKRQEESLKYTHKLLAAGYLLGTIAHDIVNHLASIRGYTKILLEKIGRGNPEDGGLNSAEVLKHMDKLESENIELLSKLSRFSQKHKEKHEPTDLNKTIEDALGLIQPLARMSNIIIAKNFEDNLPLVIADRNQMQEVLVTLLLDSLEAIPQKSKITIKTFYLEAANYVKLVLSYTGSGSKQDYLKRIAEPWFNADGLEEETGLGFSIAEEILVRQRGKIEIESSSGKGTTVIIQLPVA